MKQGILISRGVLFFSVSINAGVHAYTKNLTFKTKFYDAIYKSEMGSNFPTVVNGEVGGRSGFSQECHSTANLTRPCIRIEKWVT